MSWCWFAVRQDRPKGALASAAFTTTTTTDDDAGFLVAWASEHEEPPGAARVDSRAIDPSGKEAAVSLALAPPGVSLLFDDISVSQAIRMALSMPPPDALSTLTQGDTHYVGAVTVVRGGDQGRLNYDPFGVLFPARRLQVEAGLFAQMPAPAGPVTQRYGAGNPWPFDRFA